MYFTDPIELANRYYKEFLTQPIQHVLDVTSQNNKKLIRVSITLLFNFSNWNTVPKAPVETCSFWIAFFYILNAKLFL